MKTLVYVTIIIMTIVFIGTRAIRAYFTQPAEPSTTATSMPTVTPPVTPTATATPQPTPTLAHGEAQRVRFEVGTHGATITMESTQTFVLWAAEGQTMRISGREGMYARLTAPSGDDVLFGDDGATLPLSGDYLLTVAGTDAVSVDIRSDTCSEHC